MWEQISLPYGNSSLDITLPGKNIYQILSSKSLPGLKNEKGAIAYSLRHPFGSIPLADRVAENDRVVVIVTDNTRPCPDNKILEVLLLELEEKVPRQNIKVLVALGLHPPLDNEQLVKKLGKNIVEKYDVINHDPCQTVRIGFTSRGTPVEINAIVAESDFRICTGLIEPHFFAGFSGGRKSIAPGVSSRKSIYTNHCYSMIEHPSARAGILEGNPVHEDMLEQARIANLDFIINVILNKNREITHVVAGDPVLAHERGCQTERDIAQVIVKHKADITIATNGGAPLDLDLYQTCKGIDTASQVTRDGGVIIMVSRCFQGIGPDDFLALHAGADSPQAVLEKIRSHSTEGVCWQNQILARAQLHQEIFLLSDLEDTLVRRMMMTPIHSIEEGLEEAFKSLGNNAEIAIIPEGPCVLPVMV